MRFVCLLVGTLSILSGCDDTLFDPFQNEDKLFTVWGFIDERQLEHALRVIPVTRRQDVIETLLDDNAQIDAVVRTIELETGVVTQWSYALEELDDGTWAHIYRARFFVQHEHTYRLEIERADGRMASAETTIPFLSNVVPVVLPPTVDDDSVYQEIVVPQLETPWSIGVRYSLSPAIVIDHRRIGVADENGGWRIKVNVTADLDEIAAGFGIPRSDVNISSMGLLVEVLDEQWSPPDDEFDPAVLFNLDALSNIENGYGFFGSVGLYQADWDISAELAALLR